MYSLSERISTYTFIYNNANVENIYSSSIINDSFLIL